MGRILHLCHAFLVGVFATSTADLDAPQHAKRIAASKELARSFPWSVPACAAVARSSESPEAVQRAEKVLDRLEAIREALEWDARIWALIADPSEFDGLPWLSFERYAGLGENPLARKAFARRIKVMRDRGLFKDEVFTCEMDDYEYLPAGGAMCGINDVRFAARGLPFGFAYRRDAVVPAWSVKLGWAMLKANGRGQAR